MIVGRSFIPSGWHSSHQTNCKYSFKCWCRCPFSDFAQFYDCFMLLRYVKSLVFLFGFAVCRGCIVCISVRVCVLVCHATLCHNMRISYRLHNISVQSERNCPQKKNCNDFFNWLSNGDDENEPLRAHDVRIAPYVFQKRWNVIKTTNIFLALIFSPSSVYSCCVLVVNRSRRE